MSMNFVSYLLTEIWETWKNGSGLSREVASGASCSLSEARFVENDTMKSLVVQFMQLMRDADYLSARHTTEKLARVEQTMQLVLDEVAEVELSNRQLIEWSISWLNGSDDLLARRMRVLLILKYNENQQQATLSCFGSMAFYRYLCAMRNWAKREAADWLKLVKKELARSADQTKDEQGTVHCCYQPGNSGYSVPNDNSGTLEENKNED